MRICILTTVHQPFDTRVFQKEAVTLAREHEVTLIAPHDEQIHTKVGNVDIITVKKPSSKLLHPITLIKTLIEGLKIKCDVFHCHEPGSLLICVILKFIKRKRVIYDAHEYYPSLIAENTLFPDIIRCFIEYFMNLGELVLAHFADSIIVVREDLEKRFRMVNKNNIETIYVYPDLKIFKNLENNMKKSKNKIIIYEGYVDIRERGLDKCLRAIKIISHKYPDIVFKIVGKVPQKDLEWAEHYVSDNLCDCNFEVTTWVDYTEIPRILANSTIGIILFRSVHYNSMMGIPNKLFDYMAAGIPVVASNLPNISKIINDANCGILVDPDDETTVANALEYLFEHPDEAEKLGKNGKEAVCLKYNWENMEHKLFGVYNKLDNAISASKICDRQR